MSLRRVRNWVFTANFDESGNPPSIPVLEDPEKYKVRYYVFQTEKVSRKHYQGMVILTYARTFNAMKKLFGPTVHYEEMRGSFIQAYQYSTKLESRIHPPVEYGTIPAQGKRNDLNSFIDAVREEKITYEDAFYEYPSINAKFPRFVDKLYQLQHKKNARDNYYSFINGEMKKKVKVYYGPAGSGKTSRVFGKHSLDSIYVLSIGDGTKNSLWFDDYQGEEILLLDDFYGNIKYSFLLRILDIYPLRVQCKGSYTYVNFKTIYITSNQSINEMFSGVLDTSALIRRITSEKKINKKSER